MRQPRSDQGPATGASARHSPVGALRSGNRFLRSCERFDLPALRIPNDFSARLGKVFRRNRRDIRQQMAPALPWAGPDAPRSPTRSGRACPITRLGLRRGECTSGSESPRLASLRRSPGRRGSFTFCWPRALPPPLTATGKRSSPLTRRLHIARTTTHRPAAGVCCRQQESHS